MRFYGLLNVANQKARKAIDDVRVILNKIPLSLLNYGKLTEYLPQFIPGIWPLQVLLIVKNKFTLALYASVLLLMINFVSTLSKFTAKPLACGSWFFGSWHLDNVMTQFIINKRTDA